MFKLFKLSNFFLVLLSFFLFSSIAIAQTSLIGNENNPYNFYNPYNSFLNENDDSGDNPTCGALTGTKLTYSPQLDTPGLCASGQPKWVADIGSESWCWLCLDEDVTSMALCCSGGCGSLAKSETTEKPKYNDPNLCLDGYSSSTGYPSYEKFTEEGDGWCWSCQAKYEGTNPDTRGNKFQCCTNKDVIKTGKCGPMNGRKLNSPPANNDASLCEIGDSSVVIGDFDGPWTWQCFNSAGFESCQAEKYKPLDGVCGVLQDSADSCGKIIADNLDFCLQGTLAEVVWSGSKTKEGGYCDPLTTTWKCLGIDTGADAVCGTAPWLESKGAVSGKCGSSAGQKSLQAPDSNLCAPGSGKASIVVGPYSGIWKWICRGARGGSSVMCSTILGQPGECGSDNNKKLLTTPIELCKSGDATTVFSLGNKIWTWQCLSQDGGQTVDCQAEKVDKAVCSYTVGNEIKKRLTSSNLDLCSPGKVDNFSGSGQDPDDGPWTWTCRGDDDSSKIDDAFGCGASMEPFVGICGQANGLVANEPTEFFCASGDYSGFTYSSSANGIWRWTCFGSDTQSDSDDVDCEAYKKNRSYDYNKKRISKYSQQDNRLGAQAGAQTQREVFFIPVSHSYGQDLALSMVPLTTWTGNNGILYKYPTFLYYIDGQTPDLDSTIHASQLYGADFVMTVGNTMGIVTDLIRADQPVGLGLPSSNIGNLDLANNPASYFDYWLNYNDVVYVSSDNYYGVLAANYASVINAPLVIRGTSLDNDRFILGKNIICIGLVTGRNCDQRYNTVDDINQVYVSTVKNLTGQQVNKVLVTNTKDVDYKFTLGPKGRAFNTKKTGRLWNLFGLHSLAAPYLAAARYEVILPINDIPNSYGCGYDNNIDCYDLRDKIKQQFEELNVADLSLTRKFDLYDIKKLHYYNGANESLIESFYDEYTNSIQIDNNNNIYYIGDTGIIKINSLGQKINLFNFYDLRDRVIIASALMADSGYLVWHQIVEKDDNFQTEIVKLNLADNSYSVLYSTSVNLNEIRFYNKRIIFQISNYSIDGEKLDSTIYAINIENGNTLRIIRKTENIISYLNINNNNLVWVESDRKKYSDLSTLYRYDFNTKNRVLVDQIDNIGDFALNDQWLVWNSNFRTYLNYYNFSSNTKVNNINLKSFAYRFVLSDNDLIYDQNSVVKKYDLTTGGIDNLFIYNAFDKAIYKVSDRYLYWYNTSGLGHKDLVRINLDTKTSKLITNNDNYFKSGVVAKGDRVIWQENNDVLDQVYKDGYLTIVADPYSIPYKDQIERLADTVFSEPSSADRYIYANIYGLMYLNNSPVDLLYGRIIGFTVSDASSNIMQSLFYDQMTYNNAIAMFASSANQQYDFYDWMNGTDDKESVCNIFEDAGYKINACVAEKRDQFPDRYHDCARQCLCDNDSKFKTEYEAEVVKYNSNNDDKKSFCNEQNCYEDSFCNQEILNQINNPDFKKRDQDSKFIDIAMKMMGMDALKLKNNDFIFYADHGGPSYAIVGSNSLPDLSNSFIDTMACSVSSAHIDFNRKNNYALRAIRNGAIGIVGSVRSDFNNTQSGLITNDIYYNSQPLGYSFSVNISEDNHETLIGDPVLQINKRSTLRQIYPVD